MSKKNPQNVKGEKVETLSAESYKGMPKSRPRKGGGYPSDHSNLNNRTNDVVTWWDIYFLTGFVHGEEERFKNDK